MKKMKVISIVFAFTLAVGLLAACGGGTAAPAAPTPAPSGSAPAASAPAAAPADDKVYSFMIDYPNPENSAIYPLLVDWAEYVGQQSNGRIQAEVYPAGALGALPDCVTNCLTGMTDGFWSGCSVYAGVFPVTDAFSLPMAGALSQEVMNASLRAMVANNADMQKEWSNFHLIALHSGTPAPILFNRGMDISTPDAFKGAQMRISNKYTADWMTNLGATPVECGINSGYEYFEKNQIDSGLFFFDQLQSSALYEQIDALLVPEDCIYSLTMFCLNLDRYNELPDDLKAIIDGSTDWFYDQLPGIYNKQMDNILDNKCPEYGVEIVYPDKAMMDALYAASKNAASLWIEKMNGEGHDGQALYDEATGYIAQYNKELN